MTIVMCLEYPSEGNYLEAIKRKVKKATLSKQGSDRIHSISLQSPQEMRGRYLAPEDLGSRLDLMNINLSLRFEDWS